MLFLLSEHLYNHQIPATVRPEYPLLDTKMNRDNNSMAFTSTVY